MTIKELKERLSKWDDETEISFFSTRSGYSDRLLRYIGEETIRGIPNTIHINLQ